jgi:hypothetical protein
MSELNAEGVADEAAKKTEAGGPLAAFQVDTSPFMLAARMMALAVENRQLKAEVQRLKAAGMMQAAMTATAEGQARYWQATAAMLMGLRKG